eukprot:m.299103 g.299103  ORF g.299103 m.299103 type:complete len:155 (-) comp14037_c0_seq1:434-898(-)
MSNMSTRQSGEPRPARIYACKALVSPGALYKTVIIDFDMSAVEVIAQVLERYGEIENADEYELRYAKVQKDGKPLKRGSSLLSVLSGSNKSDYHVLADDEAPYLVEEYFAGENRRFELHRRSKEARKSVPALPHKASQALSLRSHSTDNMRLAH